MVKDRSTYGWNTQLNFVDWKLLEISKKFTIIIQTSTKSYYEFENLKGMAYRLVCPAQLKYEIRMAVTW